jgi:hypothetical protein
MFKEQLVHHLFFSMDRYTGCLLLLRINIIIIKKLIYSYNNGVLKGFINKLKVIKH